MIMSDQNSVLHERPDGMGLYHGHYKGSRIDVQPPPNEDALIWRLFVDGDPIGDGFGSKDTAEAAGKLHIERWLAPRNEDDAE